jgi:citrate synthase
MKGTYGAMAHRNCHFGRPANLDSRYDVTALMGRPLTETNFLLHQRRLPSDGERRLLDAILMGVADHGAGAPSCATARLVASGNRQSLSAAVAAGVMIL